MIGLIPALVAPSPSVRGLSPIITVSSGATPNRAQARSKSRGRRLADQRRRQRGLATAGLQRGQQRPGFRLNAIVRTGMSGIRIGDHQPGTGVQRICGKSQLTIGEVHIPHQQDQVGFLADKSHANLSCVTPHSLYR